MGVTPKQYKFDNVNYPVSENIKSSADVSEQGRHFVHEPCFTLAQQKWEYVIENTTVIHKSTDAKKGKIQVELAMRWWVSQDKYPLFTTIAVKDFDTYAEAWTYEHAVIEQLRAQLNHPMITRNAFKYFYKPDKRSFQGIASQYRLFRRIRRRLSTLKESSDTIPTLRLDT